MKKRNFAVALAVLMVMGLVACSSGISQAEYDKVVAERDALREQVAELTGQDTEGQDDVLPPSDTSADNISSNGEAKDKSPKKFDAQTVASQLEVKELSYSTKYWNYAFLVIQNNSEYDLSISANVTFYDEAGNLVGAKSTSEDAVESGYDTILYFMPDEDFATMEYELEVDEETWYECVLSDLSYDGTVAKDKVILSVTNNGEKAAEFVQASVLFFNGDTLVGFEQNYIVDDDSELKPGKTINKEMDCYEDFDSYQVFFSGRR